ncbi:hypothetical protein RJ640_030285 [Escallonia rubra]|uniref:Multidrug resistance protein n=1 Tax=Escallonia rubra TaxID=112253 RepID=A0AA88QRJ3_9ASTE|nr:hypothetical protein RJ640_030285 [Escallonia rubra]
MAELKHEMEDKDDLLISKPEDGEKPRAKPPPAAAAGTLRRIMKHSDWTDVGFMAMGTMGCVADGSSLALTMLVVSNLMNTYSAASLNQQDINKFAVILLYVAGGVGLGGFLEKAGFICGEQLLPFHSLTLGFVYSSKTEGFCWARTAERQASRLRSKYLQAVLWQDVGFFDTTGGASVTSQVVSSISTDTLTIQGVLSEKMPNFLTNIAMFIMSQLAAMYLCWRLAIIATPALFLLIIPSLVYGKLLARGGKRLHKAHVVAGGIVEQALSSIRIVYSYVGEERTVKRFSRALEPILKLGIKQGLMKGMTIGSIGAVYAIWALQGWYGSILITEKKVTGGDVFSTGVCIVYGGLSLMGALANLRYIIEASTAAAVILNMIERVPSIDSTDKEGKTIVEVKGELEFKNIDFAYPSRPLSLVLRKFNLRVMACQTIGLVGGSGSGKSTIINLIERFYDPLEGEILLDGTNIKSLQPKWLRSQMGLVDQEPVLFATSIKENILFGKEDASEEEIIQAAKAANAHSFITQLPNGYDTQVGQLGIQISGGQKQRISIARALLRDPKILLLDEATSSLDSQSEKAVQDALNQASLGRTTIIVAHRLSTLRNADMIAVIQSGQVIESGSHNQLIQNRYGSYSAMVQQQKTPITDSATSNSQDNEPIDSPLLTKHVVEASNNSRRWTVLPKILENETNQQPQGLYSPPTLRLLIQMTSSEGKATLLGCIGALTYGAIQPLHSFCLGALLSSYFIDDDEMIKSQARMYCIAFLTFAVSAFFTSVIQHYYFGVMGENLTKKIKETILGKLMTFEIEWFDREQNNSGALCSRLATDAAMVRTLVADRMSLLAQTISGVTLAVILGVVLAWNLAIIVLAIQPLIIGAFYVKAATLKCMTNKVMKAQDKSSQLASEAVGNHRIITAYYSQRKVMTFFEITQIEPKTESHKQSWYAGIALLISGFLNAASGAVIYWYGGKLLYNEKISYKHLFQIFFILVSTGRIIAETGSTTSDLSKGITALKSVFMILERKSRMDPDDHDGIVPKTVKGNIELKDVDFFYRTRPKQMILKSLNLKVDAGQVVALVGQSGSGKSTIIKLIERFYDVSRGSLEIDGIDIKQYNLRALRSRIALVSQEPTLFAGTIQENIAYANEDATDAEIIEAATLAHAHEFISSMKDGYATYCGERGLQLSGGQKQRIALARAILKNPAILLLDEATSALDINSENLVQDALEKTMVGRTCLVVAHRLSTIQKSHKIAVIENGRIVEEGSHGELLTKGENGTYFSFLKLQQHDVMKAGAWSIGNDIRADF